MEGRKRKVLIVVLRKGVEGVGVVGEGWIANAASTTGIADVVADVAAGVAAVVMAHVAEAAEIVTVNVDIVEE